MVFTKQAKSQGIVLEAWKLCHSFQYVYQYYLTMLFLICFLSLHNPLAVHTLILFFAFLKGTVS